MYRQLLNIDIGAEPLDTLEFRECPRCALRYFSPAVCGDGKFYEQLQRFPWYYLEDRYEFQVAKGLAQPGMAILEIGCGSGLFAASLPQGCHYRGLEFNGEAIRKARARGLQVDDTPIETLASTQAASFDMVCAFQVLEHLADPAALLRAAVELLKPGGLLVVAVPSEDSYMRHEINNLLNMPPHHITRWCDAALVNAASQCGVKVVRVEHEPLSDLHVSHYARATVLHWLSQPLGLRVPLISRLAASRLVRWPIAALAQPVSWFARRRRQSLHGHSVIAIYEKPRAGC